MPTTEAVTAYTGLTCERTQVALPSAIEEVRWMRRRCAPGGIVGLEVCTVFVGDGADLMIELSDERGRKHGVFKDKIYGNRFYVEIRVPPEVHIVLYATVGLPAHGLKTTSPPLPITLPVAVTQAQWSRQTVRQGEVLTLTAAVEGAPDGAEAEVVVFEYDADGAYECLTRFPAWVTQHRIEAAWRFVYAVDPEAPPPAFFFRVHLGGVVADAPLIAYEKQLPAD